MHYLISFLEGVITFISPCLLPMLPLYISYFAGSDSTRGRRGTIQNALGFILGFTALFVTMGAFAGSIGRFLLEYQMVVNWITGGIVIFFGLSFLGVFHLGIFKGVGGAMQGRELHFFSSLVFGMVFAVGWTPCVGAFLGSALMLASQQASVGKGVLLLLCYSLGLGVPFFLSAVLIDRLKGAFAFVKRNYQTINRFCGGFLILVGLLMMTGGMGRLLALLGGAG